MHLNTGSLLQGGKYRIGSVLGQGGFGITYLAEQTGLKRKVAIKEFFMKEHCERDTDTSHVSVPSSGSRELVERFKTKFIKEAQTIAALSHPNIVQIHDIFEENGTAYYVMEYHGGGALSQIALPMAADKAAVFIRQISSALSYLHDRKIMHLDVKPSNVLIDENGNAVLIDFGISKRYDEAGHQTSSTPLGISHGYAPGEQYQQATLTFSPATDIYALGATFYKLVTDEIPPNFTVVSEDGLPPFPATVPAGIASVIEKAMQSKRKDRPQSIGEFLALLDAALEEPVVEPGHVDVEETDVVVEDIGPSDPSDLPVPSKPSGFSESSDSPEPPSSGIRRLWWLWVLILGVIAGVVSYVVFSGGEDGGSEVSGVEQPAPSPVPPVKPVDVPQTKPTDPVKPVAPGGNQGEDQEAKRKAEEQKRFESDYSKYLNFMEMGAEYEKTESILSQAKSKYDSALNIEKQWKNNSTYSSRFDKNASAAVKRVEDRIAEIAAAKKKAEEEAERKAAAIAKQKSAAQDMSSKGRANCYIVSKSGTYKFRTVKGNSSESVGRVEKAEVLWESFGTSTKPSVGALVCNAYYNDGYITFETASTFREGNAVIAAKDASGKILWSWHIWLTDQPEGQTYYNGAGTMMDRNLGATSAAPGEVGALGLLYQWGRKDPFLGSSSISDEIVAESTISWPSPVSTSSSRGTVSYVMANPTTFVTAASSSDYDWHYSFRNNTLWTTSYEEKSIYDPCPAGWRVPDGGDNGVWSKALGFSAGFRDESLYNSSNKGMNFSGKFGSASTIWYPASGYRLYSDSLLYLVGGYGFYWSASPYGDGAYYLNFYYKGYVTPSSGYNRALGQSVRCLQE